jgi:hypothetical protein
MVDFIGSGDSSHSDSFGFSLEEHSRSIAAVLDATCAEPVHLLRYSMGGAVSSLDTFVPTDSPNRMEELAKAAAEGDDSLASCGPHSPAPTPEAFTGMPSR